MKRKNLIKVLIVVSLIIVALYPFPVRVHPYEVENTLKACEWCERVLNSKDFNESDFLNKYGIAPAPCVGLGTCQACCEAYRRYHNLTFGEFPTYCWLSSESPPTTPEYDLMVSVKIACGFTLVILGLLWRRSR